MIRAKVGSHQVREREDEHEHDKGADDVKEDGNPEQGFKAFDDDQGRTKNAKNPENKSDDKKVQDFPH